MGMFMVLSTFKDSVKEVVLFSNLKTPYLTGYSALGSSDAGSAGGSGVITQPPIKRMKSKKG